MHKIRELEWFSCHNANVTKMTKSTQDVKVEHDFDIRHVLQNRTLPLYASVAQLNMSICSIHSLLVQVIVHFHTCIQQNSIRNIIFQLLHKIKHAMVHEIFC